MGLSKRLIMLMSLGHDSDPAFLFYPPYPNCAECW